MQVYDCMMVFRSVTSAGRAERALLASGVPCVAVKPPASVTGGSCSHAVKFNSRYLKTAEYAADRFGVYPSGTFRVSGGEYIRI